MACESRLRSPADQVDVLEVDDVLAEPLGREALQLEPVARRRLVLDQRGGGVDAELRLGRARRRATAQPGQLLAHQVLPPGLRGRRLALPLGLGEHEGGVPAVVHVDHAVVHLPRGRADRVEEPAVVGDHHQRGGTTGEVLGQPGHRLDVEVVGRLVEHDQVVVAEQQPGQRAATPLAAGEPVDDPVEGDPGEQHLDDLAGGRVGGPLVVGAVPEHRDADAWRAGRGRRPGSGSPGAARGCATTRPSSGSSRPAEDPQQRGLAVAVAADDADPLAGADARG